jgi:gliding motility-associated-like protein
MQVACKDITVLPPPTIYMNNNLTICEGDTARLYMISTLADSIRWTTTYNIDTVYTAVDSVRVFPLANTTYNVKLYYPFGCIVDTTVNISVVKVQADAGPDRYIKDGATTVLGGPDNSINNEPFIFATNKYIYHWSPYQFMMDSTVPNAVVSPPYDFTYYLTVMQQVSDSRTCIAHDTVVVRLNCGDIYAPNAFNPTSNNSVANRFGILNKEISKLNYFRIYNRFGQLVFQTTDPTQKWDGMFNGSLAEEGVYVWEADAFCLSGKEFKKTGNVTLFR